MNIFHLFVLITFQSGLRFINYLEIILKVITLSVIKAIKNGRPVRALMIKQIYMGEAYSKRVNKSLYENFAFNPGSYSISLIKRKYPARVIGTTKNRFNKINFDMLIAGRAAETTKRPVE